MAKGACPPPAVPPPVSAALETLRHVCHLVFHNEILCASHLKSHVMMTSSAIPIVKITQEKVAKEPKEKKVKEVKEKKAKKAPKDKNAPKRASGAYMFFCQEVRTTMCMGRSCGFSTPGSCECLVAARRVTVSHVYVIELQGRPTHTDRY